MMLPCIGGILHGQGVMVHVDQRRVDLVEGCDAPLSGAEAKAVVVAYHTYIASKITTPDGTIRFLRPEAWTDYDALYFLIYGEQRVPDGGEVNGYNRTRGRRMMPKIQGH